MRKKLPRTREYTFADGTVACSLETWMRSLALAREEQVREMLMDGRVEEWLDGAGRHDMAMGARTLHGRLDGLDGGEDGPPDVSIGDRSRKLARWRDHERDPSCTRVDGRDSLSKGRILRDEKPLQLFVVHRSTLPMIRAGTPATMAAAGTCLVTTAPAPTTASAPILADCRTTAPAPTWTPCSI